MAQKKDIEAIYYLSPLQQGLLFHAVAEAGRDPYFMQTSFLLEGDLDVQAFERAWQTLVDRHAVLRTAFAWEGVARPVQVARREAQLEIERLDWRGKSPEELDVAFEEWLSADRKRGFELLRAPLMRLGLHRVADRKWYFVNSHHHLLLDGWSLSLLLREAQLAYRAELRGQPASLPEVGSFRDYVSWVESRSEAEAERFWRSALGGFTTPTSLPSSSQIEERAERLAELPFAEQTLRFDPARTRELSTWARKERVTLNTLIQGVWSLVLQRHSGEDEVVFGATVSGRTPEVPRSDSIVGLLINTLPVRVKYTPGASVGAWLRELQDKGSELRQFEWTPLSLVQRWSDVASGSSLFESIVVFDSYPEEGIEEEPEDLRIHALSRPTVSDEVKLVPGRNNYPLSLIVEPNAELRLVLCYERARFDHGLARGLLRHCEALLTQLLEGEDRRLAELSSLDRDEESLLFGEWNRPGVPLEGSLRAHELFERQVQERPNAIAVVCEDVELSYRELDARANRVARQLLAQGVKPEERVGLSIERSVEMIAGLLGILKAGAAFLPLEPKWPRQRALALLDDSRARILLTSKELGAAWRESGLGVLELDATEPLDAADRACPGVAGSAAQLAYVIYTSGSTGKPKGVGVEHRQLVHYVDALLERIGAQEPLSYAFVSTVAADLGHTSLFGALCSGGTLHVVSTERTFNPDAFAELAEERPFDVLKIVPSHLSALLEAAQPERLLPRRVLVLGGEAPSPELVARVERLAPSCLVVNHYGPTETTVGALAGAVSRSREHQARIPLGRPLERMRAYVLGGSLEPLPVGCPGELFLGGEGVTRGYLERPGLTASRFIPDPWSASGGQRLYRTGDRARILPDGSLEFLGRTDHQVKIRGHRVELGEIEAQLTSDPAIERAVAVVRESQRAQRVVAYVVPTSSAEELDVARVLTEMGRRLPDYMVPSALVALPSFPLTANGKLDRGALPEPEASGAAPAERVAPRTEVERTLAEIWAEVLGLEVVGVTDNFFALGGDSIRSLQVIARANQRGLKLSPKHLFEHPTVEGAARVAKVKPAAASGRAAPTNEYRPFCLSGLTEEDRRNLVPPDVELDDAYPLSPMQEGMLFHTLMNPGTGIYLMQQHYTWTGELDRAGLVAAWQKVAERHPILRTSFAWKDLERPLQLVHGSVDFSSVVQWIDLRGQSNSEQAARLTQILEAELEEGLDMTRAPLMRIRVARLSDEDYRIVRSFHHILTDDWCFSVLLRECLEFYEAGRRGESLELPRPRPYSDYIAWLGRQDSKAAERFWRQELRGFSSATPLGVERSLGGEVSGLSRVGDDFFELSEDTTRALLELAQKNEITPNTFVQGAWALLLASYSGERDVLFGVTVAGRPTDLPGVESIVGLFINSLPLRVEIRDEQRVLPWLKALLAKNYKIRECEHPPLVQIQGWSELPQGQALFKSLVVFENAPQDSQLSERVSDVDVSFEHDRVHTNYPLTVVGYPGERMGIRLSYDERVLDAPTVRRMLDHLQRLLESFAQNPEVRLGELARLSSEEERRLLVDYQRVDEPHHGETSYVATFEEQVERTPDRVAVSGLGERWSYAALNHEANRLAFELRARGVGPDSIVAVATRRSPALLQAALGVLKAGGAYLPLDPEQPVARLGQVLAASQARLVFTSGEFEGKLREAAELARATGARAPQVLTRDGLAAPAQVPLPNPPRVTGPAHLAYVIFTSGSTGIPKGAMVEHAGMANNVAGKVPALGLSEADVVAQTASQCFDISVWQLLSALLVGGRVHVIPDEVVADPRRLLAEVEEQSVSVLELVPSLVRELVAEHSPYELRKLRWLLPTGEALTPDVCRLWFERHPHVPLMNAYGPAECADDVALHVLREAPRSSQVPIGRPVPGVTLHVLSGGRLAPPGVLGELAVGGVNVGRGYLGDPRRTAEAFVPDAFGDVPGARLYLTGDLGRWLPDGTLEFGGRRDHQVKVRGYRIELGEVEARLAEHDAVEEAAVLVRSAAGAGGVLVAYVSSRWATAPTPRELREFLKARLPEYMVPSVFFVLDAIPRTANGKVDRKTLAALELEEIGGGASESAPRSATEELLASIWSDVLGVERVSTHVGFFELGGHSLLATQIVSRVRRAFGVDLPLRSIFDHPTIAELSGEIDVLQQKEARADAPWEIVSRSEPLPLSFAQQRLWFLSQVDSGGASYNMTHAVRIHGELDVLAFEASLVELTRRHESLRTTFRAVDGEPRQFVEESSIPELEIFDLSHLEPEHRAQRVQQLAAELSARPFELERGPLLRLRLLRSSPSEHALVVVMHHIVTDGWSMNVLVTELAELYEARRHGRAPELPPLPIQYADFAVWQRRSMDGEGRERQLGFWRERLAGHPGVIDLRPDFDRPATPSHKGARFTFELDKGLGQELQALGRREGATLFMTLFAAFSALLSARTGETDLLIGTDVAGRRRAETEGLIGFFVNLLVLRSDLNGEPSFRALLQRARHTTLEAYSNQDLPFEQVVDAVRPARGAAHHPLVQVLFVLQNTPFTELTLEGVSFEALELEGDVSRFDLGVFVEELEDGLSVSFRYSTELFREATIITWARELELLLREVVARPDEPIEVLAQEARRAARTEERARRGARSLRDGPRKRPEAKLVGTRRAGDEPLPLFVEPLVPDVDLAAWVKAERPRIEAALSEHGGLLFRGFDLRSATDFEAVARSYCGELFGEYGDLPREASGERVYHSTPYPEDKSILFHNESSHLPRWPLKQWFFCLIPAKEGGATPLVDCRRVYQALPARLKDKFRELGLKYVRNFTPGFDVAWQDFFQTEERSVVEAKCALGGMECEWLPNGGLRTTQASPAVVRHPRTGEWTFFNQVQLHHPDYLEPAVRESLVALVGIASLPRNVTYGDGSLIEPETTRLLGEIYESVAVRLPWQAGDLILLDNMLVAHARDPFVGPRKIVVAMGEMLSRVELEGGAV